MRRRTFALAVPLGALALAACSSEEEPQPAPLPAPPEDLAVDPVVIREPCERVDVTTISLPLEMTPMIVVDPGWTAVPLERDGVFLGFVEEEDRLRFRAVDQAGTLLWEAERPLSCTGFALSADGERPVAVLCSVEPRDEEFVLTATGYDLRTAAQIWQSVQIPGPLVAQGLVVAEPTDQPMGEGGPRRVLDPGSGATALAEEDLEGGRIIAEHGGVILRTEGSEVVAVAADGEERWRAALPEGSDPARVRVPRPIDATTGLVVVGDGAAPGAVLSLEDGSVVAEQADAVAHDHVMDVTVVASGAVVRGIGDDGAELWTHEDPEELAFLTAGERLAYAVRPEEGTLVVLDTQKGIMVHPFDVDVEAPLAVPEMFNGETAAVVEAEDESRFLVTTEFDPEYGIR